MSFNDIIGIKLVPGADGKGKGAPGVYCLRMCEVPMVTCILLCYTKIMTNFSLPAEKKTLQGCTPCKIRSGRFEFKK